MDKQQPKADKPAPKKHKSYLIYGSDFKFDKTLLAVIATVVVITGGYLFFQASRAATTTTTANPPVSGWVTLLKQYNCSYTGDGIPATIQSGSTGGCVKFLQFLIWTENIRYGQPLISIDGTFTPAVNADVVSFQQQNNLSPNGVVNAATWQRLNSCLNINASSTTTVWNCGKL